jgi:drug/metabolite transporter (DMT)-like permease
MVDAMKSLLGLLLASLLWLAASSSAQAAGTFGPNPDAAPSVFSYGYRGLLVGALAGVSGGYLAARRGDFERDDWRPLVLGLGIGGLSGAAIGLTLGFVDLADDRPGAAAIALRDMLYGAGFGALLGLVTGCLVIIRTRDAEHALFGAAIGTVAGTGIGLGIGIIEGRRIVDSPRHAGPRPSYHARLGAVRDSEGRLALGPALVASF